VLAVGAAAAIHAACDVNLAGSGKDEREPVPDPTEIAIEASPAPPGEPLANAYAQCEWRILDTFPEQAVGVCVWNGVCEDAPALPLPSLAPRLDTLQVSIPNGQLSDMTYDAGGQQLVLAAGECPAAGTAIAVRYTGLGGDAVAQSAEPQLDFSDTAYGCGRAQVQLRSKLPLEAGALAERLTVAVDMEALALSYPQGEDLAADIVQNADLTADGPVRATIERLRVGTPERLFADFCAEAQADDAVVLASWTATEGDARITVHRELGAQGHFRLTVQLTGARFQRDDTDRTFGPVDVNIERVEVGP
jgi:hypothetical protein